MRVIRHDVNSAEVYQLYPTCIDIARKSGNLWTLQFGMIYLIVHNHTTPSWMRRSWYLCCSGEPEWPTHRCEVCEPHLPVCMIRNCVLLWMHSKSVFTVRHSYQKTSVSFLCHRYIIIQFESCLRCWPTEFTTVYISDGNSTRDHSPLR